MVVIPFSYAFLIAWNLFFRDGAYFLDAGNFAYSLCSSNFAQLPPGEAAIWNVTSFFELHGAYTAAGVCHAINFFSNGPLSFVIFLGVQTMLIAIVGYQLAMKLTPSEFYRFLTACMLVLSSASIGSLAYPHFEPFGAALGVLGLIVYLNYKQNIGLLLLILACFTREDIGLHLFLFTLTSYFLVGNKDQEIRNRLKFISKFVFFLAATNILVTRIFFDPVNLFQIQYIGNPPFAILSLSIESQVSRISNWITSNPELISLSVLLLVAYIISKNRLFLIPIISSLPWILINFISPDASKQTLGIYHTFPWIIYLGGIAALGVMFTTEKSLNQHLDSVTQKVVIIGISLFGLYSTFAAVPAGTGYLVTSNLLRSPATWSTMQTEMRFVNNLEDQMENRQIYIDSAVASLNPRLDEKILRAEVLNQTVEGVYQFPSFVIQASLVQQIVEKNQLTIKFCLTNTPIVGFFKEDISRQKTFPSGLERC